MKSKLFFSIISVSIFFQCFMQAMNSNTSPTNPNTSFAKIATNNEDSDEEFAIFEMFDPTNPYEIFPTTKRPTVVIMQHPRTLNVIIAKFQEVLAWQADGYNIDNPTVKAYFETRQHLTTTPLNNSISERTTPGNEQHAETPTLNKSLSTSFRQKTNSPTT